MLLCLLQATSSITVSFGIIAFLVEIKANDELNLLTSIVSAVWLCPEAEKLSNMMLKKTIEERRVLLQQKYSEPEEFIAYSNSL